jgi:methylmalonyl-CoA mutase cobalamin-binding subunit
MPNNQVVVTIADSHLSAIPALVERLKAAGLTDDKTLASAGIVTGSVAHERMAELVAVQGVEAVESSGPMQIAPPDSSVQ